MKASRSVDLGNKGVIDGTHSPVIRRLAFSAGLNSNKLHKGQIIGISSGALAVASLTSGSEVPVHGIIMETVDSTAAGFVNVLVHGTVVKADLLGFSGASAPTADELAALEATGRIWAM